MATRSLVGLAVFTNSSHFAVKSEEFNVSGNVSLSFFQHSLIWLFP